MAQSACCIAKAALCNNLRPGSAAGRAAVQRQGLRWGSDFGSQKACSRVENTGYHADCQRIAGRQAPQKGLREAQLGGTCRRMAEQASLGWVCEALCAMQARGRGGDMEALHSLLAGAQTGRLGWTFGNFCVHAAGAQHLR